MITKWKDKELIKEIRLNARRMMSELGKEMVRDMKKRIAKRSGKARKSIKRSVRISRDKKDVVLTIGSDWFVARLLETGTSKMRMRAWLRPVFDAIAPTILDRFGRGTTLLGAPRTRGQK